MQLVTDTERWCALGDGRALATWLADRAGAVSRHLPPLLAVGRTGDGHLAVDVLRPAGLPLAAALDVLGMPTAGVAVTLTVPLLELARAGSSGAVVLGDARLDDVLVDDAGAVVLCDRPPGAVLLPATPMPPGVEPRPATTPPGAAVRPARPEPAADPVRPAPRAADLHPAARTLLLATRLVWERVDPREPVRPAVDRALAAALAAGADTATVDAAIDAVRTAAAPRPVRWDPPPTDVLAFAPPPPPGRSGGSIDAVVRDVVEHGLPLGARRRVPLRQAFVGLVVAAGLVTTALLTLHR